MNTAFRPARWVLAGLVTVALSPYALGDTPQASETGKKSVIVLARAKMPAAAASAEKPEAAPSEIDPALVATLANLAEDNRSELELRLIDLKSLNIAAGN